MTVEEAVKTLKANYGSYSETLKKIVDNAIEAVRKDGKNDKNDKRRSDPTAFVLERTMGEQEGRMR